MSLSVQLVPLSLIHTTWPVVESFIEDALKWGDDDYTIDQAKVFITKGDWMLLVAVDDDDGVIHGAAAVNIYNMPNARIAFVVAMGGKLITGDRTYAQLCNLLKSFGATKIRGVSRKSAAKLWERFGFEERYILVEAKL